MKFEDIRIYDSNFNLLIILPRYLSVNWEIKFCEFGLGEIVLEKTEEIVDVLTKNKYLFLVQGDIQSIVTGYKIGETCTVFTRTLEWLLTKFCVKKFSATDMNTLTYGRRNKSNLIKFVLAENLHKDFGLEFSGINDTDDMTEFVSETPSDIYSVIKSIVDDKTTGFKFYRDFEKGCFVFRLLTATKNSDIILCDHYKTSYDSEYNFDIQNEASGGIFYHAVKNMGRWDASSNTPNITLDPLNYGKYYTVSVDGWLMGQDVYKDQIILCKSTGGAFEIVDKAEPFLVEFPPEDKGIFSWTAALTSGDTLSAKKELSQKKALDMLTCNTQLSYMEDFNLGDIVKIKFFAQNLSCEKEKLISEIHIWDEPESSGAVPTTIDIS